MAGFYLDTLQRAHTEGLTVLISKLMQGIAYQDLDLN